MKNKYEELELKIVLFENDDIVTVSGEDTGTEWDDTVGESVDPNNDSVNEY